jgi:hypothetical protein
MVKQITQQQGLSFKKKKSRFNALEDRQLKYLVEKHGTRN